MHKTSKIVNLILFIINIVVIFFLYTCFQGFSLLKLDVLILIMISLLILTIIQFRHKNSILENKTYNILFFVSNVMTLLIILRDLFDSKIISGTANNGIVAFGFETSGSLFIDYNIIFLVIMFGGVLIYNILNKEKNKTKRKDKKKVTLKQPK